MLVEPGYQNQSSRTKLPEPGYQSHAESGERGRDLVDVHAAVTCEGACRRQVVGAQVGGDDPVLVHLADGRPVHEVDEAVPVHCDAWSRRRGGAGGEEEEEQEEEESLGIISKPGASIKCLIP